MKITTTQRTFQPINITIETEQDLATLFGAVAAYGKGTRKAGALVREAGLPYSGNVRSDARELATQLASAAGIPAPDFSDYLTRNGIAEAQDEA